MMEEYIMIVFLFHGQLNIFMCLLAGLGILMMINNLK